MSSHILHIQVLGGLVSRMRAVVGAIAFCEATGRELVVDWPSYEPVINRRCCPFTHGFNAAFHDLWSNEYKVTDSGECTFTKNLAGLNGTSDIKLRTCNLVDFMSYYRKPLQKYIEVLRPSQAIKEFSSEAVAMFRPGPIVGVISRCVNTNALVVGLEWSEQRMDMIAAKYPNVQFYLSCDTREAFDKLSASYKDRCISQDKTYRYDRRGIMKSAADLYTLTTCDWVVGINHSSYSEMIALMRGAKLLGSSEKPGGIEGGRYEDVWNPSDPTDVLGK